MCARKKGEEKKLHILRNFIELVTDLGINRVTLTDVAKRSGITKSGLYYYFDSKEHLMLETVNMMSDNVEKIINIEVESIDDPREKLRKFIELDICSVMEDTYAQGLISRSSADMMGDIQRYIFNSPLLVKKMIQLHEDAEQYTVSILREIFGDEMEDEMLTMVGRAIHHLKDGYFNMIMKLSKMRESLPDLEYPDVKRTAPLVASIIVDGINGFKKGEK